MKISSRTFNKFALPIFLIIVFILLFIWWGAMLDSNKSMDDTLSLTAANPQPQRLATRSPWFPVTEDDVELHVSYAGWNIVEKKRVEHIAIYKKAIDMITQAEQYIVASVFLFDCMYSGVEPSFDLVTKFTDLLVQKKLADSTITIAIVLDPLNRAYADRMSTSVQRFLDNGIDVFYSDLLTLKSADKTRLVETLHEIQRSDNFFSRKIIGTLASDIGNLKIPFVKTQLDSAAITFETAANAALLKANHRKLLVTDCDDTYEALVSSANPHNASLPSTNFAISVKGETAKYIYGVIREDIRQSMSLGGDFVLWSSQDKTYRGRYLEDNLPRLPIQYNNATNSPGRASFVTENRIRQQILDMLGRVQEGDEVRIQMFYLSNFPVINTILDAAHITDIPVHLLLDPNKDAFNNIKDGTPNRQVAAYMLEEASKTKPPLNIKIRWYSTHGEQNHAKVMSITNAKTGKYEILTGSCNWTRKNMANINMESNIAVFGSKKLTSQFNELFDRFWSNSEKGIEYSVAWDDPRFGYDTHAGMKKWSKPKKIFGIFPMKNESGRVVRDEAVYVTW